MKKILLFLIVIIATLAACNKNKITYYPVHADLKAAFNFKPGTYWIYRDSISGRVDSFFVRSNILSNTTVKDDGFSVDEIAIAISEYNIYPLPTITDTVGWTFSYISNEISIYYPDKNIYTNSIEYAPFVFYPFTDTISGSVVINRSAYGDTSAVINTGETYILNGQTFNNVAEVNHHYSICAEYNTPLTTPYSYNDWFYICPDVGLIKIIQNHPQDTLYRIWELQRWKIIN